MKNSQSGFAPLVIVLIVAGILVVGGAGYWFYQSQTPQLIGGQTDEHGCLGPAGYSWCEVKQKCLRVWEESCESANSAVQMADWETYTNTKYGYSIKYPSDEEWIHTESDNGAFVMFGTSASQSGGYIWQTEVWSKSEKSIEDLISRFGLQFSDRKESRKNITINEMPALLVTVSASPEGYTDWVGNTEWVSNTVYIEHNDKIYVINDGASGYPGFVDFYNSFRFIQ